MEMIVNTTQKLALTIAILGVVGTASTQLTDILSPFGSMAPAIVKEIVSLATFVSGILGTVLTFTTGQSNIVKQVQDMPGVEKIIVNSQASAALATLAVDSTQPKIETMPSALSAVTATAKAAE